MIRVVAAIQCAHRHSVSFNGPIHRGTPKSGPGLDQRAFKAAPTSRGVGGVGLRSGPSSFGGKSDDSFI
jgi:hypothetical protein